MANEKNQQKHPDDETMVVDKKMLSIEEQATSGGLHVAHNEDSRANLLESKSFEDHHQKFRLEPLNPANEEHPVEKK